MYRDRRHVNIVCIKSHIQKSEGGELVDTGGKPNPE
jgi:hypothetical protein